MMKITVINGTEKKGVTHRLKEIFLEPFRGDAEITEFYLPKDGPGFCKMPKRFRGSRRRFLKLICWCLLHLHMFSTRQAR